VLLRWVRALARIPAIRQNSGLVGVSSGPNLFALAKARNAGNRGSHGGLAMSFVAWQILRRAPKPLLLMGLIFALVAAARA
jgi:hypothetical protein